MAAHASLTGNCGRRENRSLNKEQRETEEKKKKKTGGGSNSGDREIVAKRREAELREPPGFGVYV